MQRDTWETIGDFTDIISKGYGLKISHYEPVRKIMKLVTNKGVKAVKIVDTSYNRVEFSCEAMEHARKHGFKNIPKVLQTRDGKIGINTDAGILMIIDWIDAKEAKYNNDLNLKLAIEAFAELHQASKGLNPSKSASPRIYWGKWIENFNMRCKDMLIFKEAACSKKKKSDFDNMVIEYVDYFYSLGIKSIRHLKKNNYAKVSEKYKKEKTFCHHDTGNQNVLITKDNNVYLIDFDFCILDMTIHDLANFIMKNVRYKEFNIDKIDFILNTYQNKSPVTEDQIKIMKAFMEFPQEFWEFGSRYYIRKSPVEKQKCTQRMRQIVNDIPTIEKVVKKLPG